MEESNSQSDASRVPRAEGTYPFL